MHPNKLFCPTLTTIVAACLWMKMGNVCRPLKKKAPRRGKDKVSEGERGRGGGRVGFWEGPGVHPAYTERHSEGERAGRFLSFYRPSGAVRIDTTLLCLAIVTTSTYWWDTAVLVTHIALSGHTTFFVCLFCHKLLELSAIPSTRQDTQKQKCECFCFSYELVFVQMTWISFPCFQHL